MGVGGRRVGSWRWDTPYIGTEKHAQTSCAHTESQKQTCVLVRPMTILDSSLTPNIALAVLPPSYTMYSKVNWMPVKPDTVICSSVIGVSEWCKSVAFTSSYKFDSSSCRIALGFGKSAHIIVYGCN